MAFDVGGVGADVPTSPSHMMPRQGILKKTYRSQNGGRENSARHTRNADLECKPDKAYTSYPSSYHSCENSVYRGSCDLEKASRMESMSSEKMRSGADSEKTRGG